MRLGQGRGTDAPVDASLYRGVALDLLCEKLVLDGMCPHVCEPGDGADGYCPLSVGMLERWIGDLDLDG